MDKATKITELKEIYISPLTYKLVFEDEPKMTPEGDYSAYTDNENLKLVIKRTLAKGKMEVTILHEVLHAILIQAGLNLDEADDSHFEQIIEVLSHSLLALIKNNPNFIKLL